MRRLIFTTLPDASEEMKWGAPVFFGGSFYIVGLKDHVNFGFSIQGLTKDDLAFFEGSGKTMRHIKVNTIDFDENRIVEALKLVDKRARE